jgi:hypothetical protein
MNAASWNIQRPCFARLPANEPVVAGPGLSGVLWPARLRRHAAFITPLVSYPNPYQQSARDRRTTVSASDLSNCQSHDTGDASDSGEVIDCPAKIIG